MRVRSIALFLVFVIVFSFSAFADQMPSDFQFVRILDYSTANNSGSNYVEYTGSAKIRYALPNAQTKQYVDMIVWSTTSSFALSEDTNNLTVQSLGNRLYRVYGSLGGYLSSALYFTVSSSSSTTQAIEFKSINFTSLKSSHFAEIGIMTIGSAPTYTMSSTTDLITHNWGSGNYGSTVAHFSCPDWELYDYVTFFVYGFEFNANSVAARFGSFPLDCTVSYLDSANTTSAYSRWSAMITVDLTGIDRTKTDVPQIEVSGSYGSSEYTSYIGLISVTGHILADHLDPYIYWLRNISASINSSFDTLAARQDAYHADIQAWQQQHDQVISGYLQGISNGLASMTNVLQASIDSAGIYIVDTLSSFRTSMESYLENLPVRIAEEISKIFKPTEGKFEAAKDESQELAEDKLGAVYQSAVVIDQIAGAFTNQTPQTSIAIPLVSVEVLPGVPFAFGGWDVPVVPSGLEFFVETLKFVIDIVCTLAFLNGMKRRLDGLFGGESGAD